MSVRELVTDEVVGRVAALGGTAGVSIQLVQDTLSIAALVLNIAVAIGGLLLLRKRHMNADMERERQEYEKDRRDN